MYSKENVKLIKQEIRIAYIIATNITLLLFIANIAWIILCNDCAKVLIFIDAIIVLLCAVLIFLMNRKYYKDLKERQKRLVEGSVKAKREYEHFEAGSGALYIPILADIASKLWGQKMRKIDLYYLKIGNREYEVTKELFDEINEGDLVNLHIAENSNILLEITAVRNLEK